MLYVYMSDRAGPGPGHEMRPSAMGHGAMGHGPWAMAMAMGAMGRYRNKTGSTAEAEAYNF